MTKKKIIKEDGRYLIFYEFEEEKESGPKLPEKKKEAGREE
ncbi:MAG: hypothetical protein ABIH66_10240 [bacterium]